MGVFCLFYWEVQLLSCLGEDFFQLRIIDEVLDKLIHSLVKPNSTVSMCMIKKGNCVQIYMYSHTHTEDTSFYNHDDDGGR